MPEQGDVCYGRKTRGTKRISSDQTVWLTAPSDNFYVLWHIFEIASTKIRTEFFLIPDRFGLSSRERLEDDVSRDSVTRNPFLAPKKPFSRADLSEKDAHFVKWFVSPCVDFVSRKKEEGNSTNDSSQSLRKKRLCRFFKSRSHQQFFSSMLRPLKYQRRSTRKSFCLRIETRHIQCRWFHEGCFRSNKERLAIVKQTQLKFKHTTKVTKET